MAIAPVETRSSALNLTVHNAASIRNVLLPLLHHYLPYTIVVYRRLQYHLLYPNEPHSKIISVLPEGLTAENLLVELRRTVDGGTCTRGISGVQGLEVGDGSGNHDSPEWEPTVQDAIKDIPWMVCQVDVSRLIGTTVYIFSSVELPRSSSTRLESPSYSLPSCSSQTISQLSSLFTYIRNTLIPTRPFQAPEGWPWGKQMKKLEYRRSNILLGAIHENVVIELNRMGITNYSNDPSPPSSAELSKQHDQFAHTAAQASIRILRTDFPYLKYLFPRQSYHHHHHQEQSTPLHPSLKFHPLLTAAEYNLVLTRTHIPRTISLLASLPNIGLYHVSDTNSSPKLPISWTFLGLDASLTSLHVEPAFRGKGLAEKVARHLFERTEGLFSGEIGFRDPHQLNHHDNGNDDKAPVSNENIRVFTSTSSTSTPEGRNGGSGVEEAIQQPLGAPKKSGEYDHVLAKHAGGNGVGIKLKQTGWNHADVHEENSQSRRVMEKLGGRVGWRVAWMEVDVGEMEGEE